MMSSSVGPFSVSIDHPSVPLSGCVKTILGRIILPLPAHRIILPLPNLCRVKSLPGLQKHASSPAVTTLHSILCTKRTFHQILKRKSQTNATHPEHRDVGPEGPFASELLQHFIGRVNLILATICVRDDGYTGPWPAGYCCQVEP